MQLEGKLRHIGLSEVNLEETRKIRSIVEVVSVQNLYNLADRHHDPVRRLCEENGLTFMPWYPLANGSLSEPGGLLSEIAARHGAEPAQIALAWILQGSPSTVLIAGTSSQHHLEQNVLAAAIKLDDAEVDLLNAL